MRIFGLVGKHISHSFSPTFFEKKWHNLGINDCVYRLFAMSEISEFAPLIKQHNITGLNVTIPYKKSIIPYLNRLSEVAELLGAVNTVAFQDGQTIGHNTDVIGFEKSLQNNLNKHNFVPQKALILATGGAAQAVAYVLTKMQIDYRFVSTQKFENYLTYSDLNATILAEHNLIVNCSPRGMFPNINTAADLPYSLLNSNHFLFDLVYNPTETLFLQLGKAQNCICSNGLEMLQLQAEAAWHIWTENRY